MDKLLILRQYLKAKILLWYFRQVPPQKLRRWQDGKIKKFISRTLSKSPYYSRIVGKGHADLADMPVMDKNKFMSNFDSINTRGVKLKDASKIALSAESTRDFSEKIDDLSVGLSSGTSGNRAVFLISDTERALWLGNILARADINPFRRERIAFFLRANSNLYSSIGSFLLDFRFFDLIDDLEHNIAKLDEYRPTILVAQPSLLLLLSKAKKEGRLHCSPKRIISVAEVLYEHDSSLIKEAFSVKMVEQVYQCTEGFIAMTCRYGTLHVNEDFIRLELIPLDGDRKRFSPIVTDFSRITQPIVRYRLDDVLLLDRKTCRCRTSFASIKAVEGRSDEVLYFRSRSYKDRLIPIFPDFITRKIIFSDQRIEDFRVEQIEKDSITVYLSVDKRHFASVRSSVRKSLLSLFERKNISPPYISFRQLSTLPGTTKRRRIIRKFKI